MKKCCTKCGTKYPRTREYFVPDKRRKDGLGSRCRRCHNAANVNWRKKNPEKNRECNKKYRQQNKTYYCELQQNYIKTLRGHVAHLLGSIKSRCTNLNHSHYKYYGGRGIQCCFTSDELFNWVIANNINPRGLQIHRINNNDNYVLDNIEFLTDKNHRQLHKLQN